LFSPYFVIGIYAYLLFIFRLLCKVEILLKDLEVIISKRNKTKGLGLVLSLKVKNGKIALRIVINPEFKQTLVNKQQKRLFFV
jgi:hypothetical protein